MKILTPFILSSTLALGALPLSAIADSKLATQNPHYGEKGWDVEVMAGLGTVSNHLLSYKTNDDDEKNKNFAFITFNTSYFGEKFYFKADDEDGLFLGYNLHKDGDSALDVFLAPEFFGPSDDNDLLSHLDDRDVDLHAGLRYTKYMGDSLYEIDFSSDISGAHGGYILSASYEKEWQKKNWVITGAVSAGYVSSDMTDYYFGVDDNEATANFSAYQAGAYGFATAGVKAEYPINENWVFMAAVSHLISNDEVADSTISDDKDSTSAAIASIKYHF